MSGYSNGEGAWATSFTWGAEEGGEEVELRRRLRQQESEAQDVLGQLNATLDALANGAEAEARERQGEMAAAEAWSAMAADEREGRGGAGPPLSVAFTESLTGRLFSFAASPSPSGLGLELRRWIDGSPPEGTPVQLVLCGLHNGDIELCINGEDGGCIDSHNPVQVVRQLCILANLCSVPVSLPGADFTDRPQPVALSSRAQAAWGAANAEM
eukprot:Hpha_TRINITY_DN27471_c0_g1::TRINITY_DN27471_c0_g1_i1::g.193818::m.193818